MNVAQIEGLILNTKNLELKRSKVSFFKAEYSCERMHPIPKKIQGMTKMTTHEQTTASQLHRNGYLHGKLLASYLPLY